MALTDFCDVLGSAHEDGFNRIIFHVMSQRPSLFQYGTASFDYTLVNKPIPVCCPVEFIHAEVIKRHNPIVGHLDPLPIPGYTGSFGLEYNFSLSQLLIDFEPSNRITLPPELGTRLEPQSFALQAVVCGGIGCPETEILNRFIIYPEPYRPTSPGKLLQQPPSAPDSSKLQGFPFQRVRCFKLELYAVLSFARETYSGEPVLGMKLQNLEIVDIKPDKLEDSIECLIRTTLILGIFPKLRIALNALTYNIMNFIVVGPTPISTQVPFNPSVENDSLTVKLSLTTP